MISNLSYLKKIYQILLGILVIIHAHVNYLKIEIFVLFTFYIPNSIFYILTY